LEEKEILAECVSVRSNDGYFSLVPHHAAITAQQSCSINSNSGKNLIGRDGISKTIVCQQDCRVKKCAPSGNFAHAETFQFGMPGYQAQSGGYCSSMITKGDG